VPITRADRRLLLVTGGLVVLAAVFVAVVLVIATGGSTPVEHKPLYLGVAKDLHDKIRDGGPLYFANPFGGNGFWLDLDQGDFVALSVVEPGTTDCQVKWRDTRKAYVDCHRRRVDPSTLTHFETTVAETGEAKGGLYIDLRKRV
jgi:hypothetical protein